MTLQEYRADFYTFSGKASDITRQLALAGIALIWIFKKDVDGHFTVPHDLLVPGMLILIALALDLIQYIVASLIWFFYYRYLETIEANEEKENKEEEEKNEEEKQYSHSAWLEVPIWIPFALKTVATLTAYYYIVRYMLNALSFK